MGGLLILLALVGSTLLWADLFNRKVLLAVEQAQHQFDMPIPGHVLCHHISDLAVRTQARQQFEHRLQPSGRSADTDYPELFCW
jgi:hypothetical protein